MLPLFQLILVNKIRNFIEFFIIFTNYNYSYLLLKHNNYEKICNNNFIYVFKPSEFFTNNIL